MHTKFRVLEKVPAPTWIHFLVLLLSSIDLV